jgi:hypothetical protein
MNILLAFICRCALFFVYTVVSRLENEAVELTMFQRAVITCLQVCLLGVAWVLYEICVFVIKAVSVRYPYGTVPEARDGPQQLDEDSALVDERDPDTHGPDAAQPVPNTSVVFASHYELQKYVCKVHVIGVVVWSTMLSMDYALSQVSFAFLLGMLIGNVASTLTLEHSQPQSGRRRLPMATFSTYWALVGTLVVLYMAQDGASAVAYTEGQVGISPNRIAWTDVLALVNVMLSPLSCGVSWTYWMDGGTLLKHHRTSLYSSVLLSLPVVISVQRQFLVDMLSRYSPFLLAHVLLTEPLLKFMVIYVLTLSLETEAVLEMLVVNAAVTGICYVSFTPHADLFDAFVGLLVALLVLLHLTRLARRAWAARQKAPNFTIA